MAVDSITYKQLNELLVRLGFTRRRVKGKWLRYEQPDADLVIVLVEKKPNQLVRVTDAVSARRHLVEKGLISEQELKAFFARPVPVESSAAKS